MGVMVPTLIVVISGIHAPSLNANVILTAAANPQLSRVPLLCLSQGAATSVLAAHSLRQRIDHHCRQHLPQPSSGLIPAPNLLIWAFSAGCVGAAGLAYHWHQHRGKVLALFAVDGWGVPLSADFPVYRLSHDWFTHVTCQGMGAGPINFWAEPAVAHLDFWCRLNTIAGWQSWHPNDGPPTLRRLTAGEFLCYWSQQHLEPDPRPS